MKKYEPVFIDSGKLLEHLDNIVKAHTFCHGDNLFVDGLEYTRDIIKEERKNAQKANGFMR